MQYKSPLRIFGDKKQIDFSATNLEKLETSLLSNASLTQKNTVEINGKTYHQNELKNAIHQLKIDGDFHLQLFKNKPLLAFIEEGDTTIFRENGRIDELFNPVFKEKIKPYFIHRFNEVLYENVTQPGFQSIRKLKDIRESYFKMPADFEQNAYAKTYTYLENYVSDGIRNLSDPFREGKGRGLKKEALEFFDLHTLNVFLNLPDYFSEIKEKYAILAHNYVVQVLRKNPIPEQTSRPVARVLLNACRTDAELRNDPQSRKLVPVFERILAKKEIATKKFVGGSWKGWVGFVMVICFLIFFGIFGELPARFQKKSDYQKSVDRYNYYRNKKYQPVVREESTVEMGDLQGAWRADLFMEKARIYRTFHFYTENIGKSVFQFVTEQGEEQARITAWFYWEVDNSRQESQFDLLKTRHRGDFLLEGDTSAMSELYQNVLENVKSRMKNELFVEAVKFSDDDYFQMGNRKFYREANYEVADLSPELQSGIKKMQRFELDLITAGNNFSRLFVKDSLVNNGLNFTFSEFDNGVYLQSKEAIGYLELTDSTNYFRPHSWTTGKGYQRQGVFKNARYLRRDTVWTGDLEMYYHYRRGFRFREFNN